MRIVMKENRGWVAGIVMICALIPGLAGCEASSEGEGEDGGGVGEESGETGLESGEETGATGPIEIAGDWESGFSAETITSEFWDDGFAVKTVTVYDNAANWAVTQNASDAEFSPDAFNKTIWTEPTETGFAYCTVAFSIETQAEAEAASTDEADDSDLDDAGCFGFPWTVVVPAAADSGE